MTPDHSHASTATFCDRHIGPRGGDIDTMLAALEYSSLDDLTRAVVPEAIFDDTPLELPPAVGEEQALAELRAIAAQNTVLKSFIGQGYYGTHTPRVIERNMLQNPAWYTAYTPYQPEISQGRLELLFYFQTLVAELTGMDIANASLLDEATAAAEAMTLCHRSHRGKRDRFLVSRRCHPQTIEVLETRARPLGIDIVEIDERDPPADCEPAFGVLFQYPAGDGGIYPLGDWIAAARAADTRVVIATDLLALTLLKSPGELGADMAVGSAQRFGVPLGFGGPHAGFFATLDKYKRTLPGRLVGQSVDADGRPAYRLALQTREQHIRREKATSNICTAQALLAMMAAAYACYHGPEGLRAIAWRTHRLAARLKAGLRRGGWAVTDTPVLDTLSVETGERTGQIIDDALAAGYNLRRTGGRVGISLDETASDDDVEQLLRVFGGDADAVNSNVELDGALLRDDIILTQEVFHRHRSETEMMRYLRRLADKDVALDRAMIPLGSCTMKLNAAAEMTPVSWPEFSQIHPFAPAGQWRGYRKMIEQLEAMLCACTGYAAMSLQPNAGSQGEYAGLLAIKQYHEARGQPERDICLIPASAHGTNPASAQMANMRVQVVACDAAGNVDLDDLTQRIQAHPGRVAAIMITYPSTHGVFEDRVREVCELVHQAGGQVFIDGANLNALVGVANMRAIGGDVSHLNLHKTFCIPHGGGGPGVGPVGVAEHLAPFLPRDGVDPARGGAQVSAAPFGSAGILAISWMYIRMMGADGLKRATQVAILNANYVAARLRETFPILYTGNRGLVAHECIVDTRPMRDEAGVTVDDIAKRLIDYGFHAPTMSFPVPGTLMIEPTESESLEELERFCRAMLSIHVEYERLRRGDWAANNNPLRNAPHSLPALLAHGAEWNYDLGTAVHPDPETPVENKYWPPVGRVDNVHGDRNLICSCPPLAAYATEG